jgi:hypothetical protein
MSRSPHSSAIIDLQQSASASKPTLELFHVEAGAIQDLALEDDLDEVIMTPDGDLSRTVLHPYSSQSAPVPFSKGPKFSRLQIDESGRFQNEQHITAHSSGSWSRYMSGIMNLMCLKSSH